MQLKINSKVLHSLFEESNMQKGLYDIILGGDGDGYNPVLAQYDYNDDPNEWITSLKDIIYSENDIAAGLFDGSFNAVLHREHFYTLDFDVDKRKISCFEIYSGSNSTQAQIEKLKETNNYFPKNKYDPKDLVEQFAKHCKNNMTNLLHTFNPKKKA